MNIQGWRALRRLSAQQLHGLKKSFVMLSLTGPKFSGFIANEALRFRVNNFFSVLNYCQRLGCNRVHQRIAIREARVTTEVKSFKVSASLAFSHLTATTLFS
jgi:hypothetical protein